MDWEKIYDKLIQNAINENRTKSNETYYEKHHIKPRHLGGSDDNSNLVLLTFREHYIAHYLLWRIHGSLGDQLAYKMRYGQREEAQRLRSQLAVEANKNGGNGFWKKGGWNPMKDENIVRRSMKTKMEKYGSLGIYSEDHYNNTIKGMNKPGGLNDPETRKRAYQTRMDAISKMSDKERKKIFGRPGELNGNWGKIKGRYEVIDPNGNITKYKSQDEIMEKLNVSQSFLVRRRNTGKLKSKSANPKFKKWDDWEFKYFKN